ncbi:MAG: CoA transferase, partial [Pseudomonadota bacterium]
QLVAPYGVFETADGAIALAPSNDGVYRKLLAVLDMEHLLEDERIDTNEKRMKNRALMRDILEPVFTSKSSDHWIETMNAAGVPAGPILSVPGVFADPQVIHREMVMPVDHGDRGTVQMLGFPMKFSQEPCQVRHPAPELGEHSAEVLRDAGFALNEVTDLRDRGVVWTG